MAIWKYELLSFIYYKLLYAYIIDIDVYNIYVYSYAA